jgi:hypothetical protein
VGEKVANEVIGMTEADLDLLDTYLDGELSMPDSQDLWRRLDRDAELATVLDSLRADRAERLSIWNALEPDEQAAAEWSNQLTRVMRRRRMLERVTQTLRYAGAAAALVVIGFAMGWNQQRAFTAGPMQNGTGFSQISTNSQPSNVLLRDPTGRVIAVQPFGSPQDASEFVQQLNSLQAVQQQQRDAAIVPAADEQY